MGAFVEKYPFVGKLKQIRVFVGELQAKRLFEGNRDLTTLKIPYNTITHFQHKQ